MSLELRTYKNSTELANLNGVPLYMSDMVDACLRGQLNLFLQGDTGSGKTQLAKDVMAHFGDDKSIFILGRNDMDSRGLFTQLNIGRLYNKPENVPQISVNPDTGEIKYYYKVFDGNGFVTKEVSPEQTAMIRRELDKWAGTTQDITELTQKINANLIVVDELPNCVPEVRGQLFNLFDGCIEINGKLYSLGKGYSVGIATGNVGQQFTESNNDLGRALKDRMHVILDTDYFRPQPIDDFDILMQNTDPRVSIYPTLENKTLDAIEKYHKLKSSEIPFDKFIVLQYLIHGLDYLEDGKSKIAMKSGWPNKVSQHSQGSDEALILPVSKRAAKSIVTLSQALDEITREKGAEELNYLDSMMTAFRFVSAYSGVLNEAAVRSNYNEDHYAAMDAVIENTRREFDDKSQYLLGGLEMLKEGKKSKELLDNFSGRWSFMKSLLEKLSDRGDYTIK